MNFFMKLLTQMRHRGGQALFGVLLPRTQFNYQKEVGTGLGSSVVTAPLQWIQRSFIEAPLTVTRDGEVVEHPMIDLVGRPNQFYGEPNFWAATLLSYLIDGNAYWIKVRDNSRARLVQELWYVPHWTVEPQWPSHGREYISHYEYYPGAVEKLNLEVADVVHFRHGVDPENQRKGLSPLKGALREIFMDLEASSFTATLLRNLGVPGLVISPDTDEPISPDDVEATKQWIEQNFTGDYRGKPLIMGSRTTVSQYGFDPKGMDLSTTRDIAEERVCSCLGIPAAVVGFGTGLQQTKVGATMSELRKEAWTGGIIPIHRVFASTLRTQLLPDFGNTDGIKVEFDLSDVMALQEDENERNDRILRQVQGGVRTVAEAREEFGLDVLPQHQIFLRPAAAFEVPADGSAPVSLPPPDEPPPDGQPPQVEKRSIKQRRVRPTRAQLSYVRALERMMPQLMESFEQRLSPFFNNLGATAAAIASDELDDIKQLSPEDEVLALRILDEMDIAASTKAFERIYQTHYVEVARRVSEVGELIGLATDLPDPVMRSVIASGGRRAGLIDLSAQTKSALFRAIEEGRALGEGAVQLSNRIGQQVPRGPWTSVDIRSRVIARTETKFAQNESVVARTRHEGIQRVMIFDGRLGPDRSDPDHIARDGSVVSIQEAEQMARDEHPNGTLSFTPLPGDIESEVA